MTYVLIALITVVVTISCVNIWATILLKRMAKKTSEISNLILRERDDKDDVDSIR